MKTSNPEIWYQYKRILSKIVTIPLHMPKIIVVNIDIEIQHVTISDIFVKGIYTSSGSDGMMPPSQHENTLSATLIPFFVREHRS